MSIHKDYGYQHISHQIAGGILNVRLLGTDKKVSDALSVRASPYDLTVGITLNAPSDNTCSFSVESIKLVSTKSEAVIFSKSGIKESFVSSPDKRSYDAIFLFGGLELKYEDYALDLIFSLTPGCSVSSAETHVRLPLKTDYQEKNITIWDMIMGI